ncbi:MAG: hypothetical protein U0640_02080 [Phycisphaerales bacterium]
MNIQQHAEQGYSDTTMQPFKHKVGSARGARAADDAGSVGTSLNWYRCIASSLYRCLQSALFTCMVVVWIASAAIAQVSITGAGAPVRLDDQGRPAGWHAWFMVLDSSPINPQDTATDRATLPRTRAMLLHVPPSISFAPRDEQGGMARQLASLDFAYDTPHIGASLNRVYLAVESNPAVASIGPGGEPLPPPPTAPTRVIAIPTGFYEGRWLNMAGPPEELRALQADRPVVSFTVCDVGPIALLGPGGRGLKRVDEYELLVLPSGLNQNWQNLALPPFSDDSLVSLSAGNEFITAFAPGADADPPRFAVGKISKREIVGPPVPTKVGGTGQSPSTIEIEWRVVALPKSTSPSVRPRFAVTRRGIIAAVIVPGVEKAPATLEAWSMDPQTVFAAKPNTTTHIGGELTPWRLLAKESVSIDDAIARDQNFAVAALDGEDTIVVAWPPGKSLSIKVIDPWTRLGYAMISTSTGRMIESGPLTLISPVTRHDYRMIGVLVAWVIGLIALVLIRPPKAEYQLSLPEDISLAEPLRRLVAGMIDLGLAMTLGGIAAGNSLGDLVMLDISDLLTTQQGHITLLAMLAVGFVSGSFGEFMFGRSPGKAIAGCFVVKVGSDVVRANERTSERANEAGAGSGSGAGGRKASRDGDEIELMFPSLPEAMLRNFIKWFLPPAALAGVWREAGRHRGEQYTGTAVVVPVEEDEEWDEEM